MIDISAPVLAIAAADKSALRSGRRMRTNDLRGSSALAYEADVVLVLNNKFDIVARHHLTYDLSNAERFRDYAVLSIEKNRFGRDGDNVESARRMFAGERVHRDQRSIYLSAARSEIFNAVLAARIADGSWAGGAEGEVWMLDGSQSVFGPEPDSAGLAERVARQDIHATGPMWGQGELRPAGAVRALERAAVEPFADLRAGLEAAGLKQERRALRVRVDGLAWSWPGGRRPAPRVRPAAGRLRHRSSGRTGRGNGSAQRRLKPTARHLRPAMAGVGWPGGFPVQRRSP